MHDIGKGEPMTLTADEFDRLSDEVKGGASFACFSESHNTCRGRFVTADLRRVPCSCGCHLGSIRAAVIGGPR